MIAPHFLHNGPTDARLTVALGHGAGAPMDSPFMSYFAQGLAAKYRVVRFEFPYMAARRKDGKVRPPDRAPVLLDTWQAVIAERAPGPLVIGGKSMGGRMASLIAAEPGHAAHVRGLLCLGYPFYGAGRKDKPRIDHLMEIKLPTLICQGTRDPMGDHAAISKLHFPRNLHIHWAEDGNHDLCPRKASGRTPDENWREALDAAMAFLSRLA